MIGTGIVYPNEQLKRVLMKEGWLLTADGTKLLYKVGGGVFVHVPSEILTMGLEPIRILTTSRNLVFNLVIDNDRCDKIALFKKEWLIPNTIKYYNGGTSV